MFFDVLFVFFFTFCVFKDMGWTDLHLAAWIGNVELVNRKLENTQCHAINEKDVKEGERKKERARMRLTERKREREIMKRKEKSTNKEGVREKRGGCRERWKETTRERSERGKKVRNRE